MYFITLSFNTDLTFVPSINIVSNLLPSCCKVILSETRRVISLLAVWLIVDFVNELIYSDVLEYELFNASSTIFSSNSVDILALAFKPNS